MRTKKKGNVMKILLIIFGVIAGILLLAVLGLAVLSKMPAVKHGYWNDVDAKGELEKRYTQLGTYQAEKACFDSGDEKIGAYQIWYPAELTGFYPVVVMANGTGVPASKYEAVLEHLATWGFLVIGNEDASSWDGVSSSESLDFILKLNMDPKSPFYQKVDTAHIGIAGHSQGGVGAINAATSFDNSSLYTSVYVASATWIDLAIALEWPYDITKLSAPCFMTAGTGQADAETIAPLDALNQSFEDIDNGYPIVIARRSNTDHGQMLSNADGYMTTWFCWTLKGDAEAAKVFCGSAPEILSNTENWQDVQIKYADRSGQ